MCGQQLQWRRLQRGRLQCGGGDGGGGGGGGGASGGGSSFGLHHMSAVVARGSLALFGQLVRQPREFRCERRGRGCVLRQQRRGGGLAPVRPAIRSLILISSESKRYAMDELPIGHDA